MPNKCSCIYANIIIHNINNENKLFWYYNGAMQQSYKSDTMHRFQLIFGTRLKENGDAHTNLFCTLYLKMTMTITKLKKKKVLQSWKMS